jgi:hypothetical protein
LCGYNFYQLILLSDVNEELNLFETLEIVLKLLCVKQKRRFKCHNIKTLPYTIVWQGIRNIKNHKNVPHSTSVERKIHLRSFVGISFYFFKTNKNIENCMNEHEMRITV